MSRQKRLKRSIRNPQRQARRARARKGRDARWDALYGKGGWLPAGAAEVQKAGPSEPVR